MTVLRILGLFVLLPSLILLGINLYGLSQELRPSEFNVQDLRFGEKDVTVSKEEFLAQIDQREDESQTEYTYRLTNLIADGTAHIHWEEFDPKKFHQLVPLWENWIIHIMGLVTGIPEYERYHFSNPYKSIERGIGICGDASMVMTQLLEKHGIQAEILTFPGHVVVTAEVEGKRKIFDPDFGVVLPFTPPDLKNNVTKAAELYMSRGYEESDRTFFLNSYSKPYVVWDGPEEFITKKFYFEKVAYVLKWVLPVLGVLLGAFWTRSFKQTHS
ncbi:hypothetical protein [Glaciecola petra]|uniref:Transglutaminase-like domain-containing protein n=1 Tax=Glaciecola petra TaxID=3075602 RepID=A0ABU2ZMH2_9ALTE|nr:hypothetical protein [Aestuariibacter sp. P117]MDT0593600.1 hypothetical protein [Aestuariibacter sp. P117]